MKNENILWVMIAGIAITVVALCVVSERNQALQRRVTEIEQEAQQAQAQFYNMQLETERIRTNLAAVATLAGQAILKQQAQLDCLNMQTAMLQVEIEHVALHTNVCANAFTNYTHTPTNYFFLPSPPTNGVNAPMTPHRERTLWNTKPYGGGVQIMNIDFVPVIRK